MGMEQWMERDGEMNECLGTSSSMSLLMVLAAIPSSFVFFACTFGAARGAGIGGEEESRGDCRGGSQSSRVSVSYELRSKMVDGDAVDDGQEGGIGDE
jgi:hypothetical protein